MARHRILWNRLQQNLTLGRRPITRLPETSLGLGRIVTVFTLDCRLGLPTRKPYVLRVAKREAAVVIARELAPLEFVDPGNALTVDPRTGSVSTAKPLSLPSTKDVAVMAFTVVPKEKVPQSLEESNEMMKEASVLAVFEPLGQPVRIRNLFSTEIAIAVEATEEDWKRVPSDKLDETHIAVWDEFARTYHMVTADVRPPLWGDGHRLVVPKQGWVAYSPEVAKLPTSAERLATPIPPFPLQKHQLVTAYAQEGTFSFDVEKADEVMRRFLSEGEPVPLGRDTLSGARRAVDLFRSGKAAVIESTIAMEVAVSAVLREEKLSRGVSKKKLDDYKKEVGLAYQLNVELPLLLHPITEAERATIGAADKVRKRRNEIVHEGAQPGKEEGQTAVNSIRALLDLLRTRGYKV